MRLFAAGVRLLKLVVFFCSFPMSWFWEFRGDRGIGFVLRQGKVWGGQLVFTWRISEEATAAALISFPIFPSHIHRLAFKNTLAHA